MDPNDPLGDTAEQRYARSATLWKLIAAGACGAALAAVIVVSCLDRGPRASDRSDREEPPFVETTGAPYRRIPQGDASTGGSPSAAVTGFEGTNAADREQDLALAPAEVTDAGPAEPPDSGAFAQAQEDTGGAPTEEGALFSARPEADAGVVAQDMEDAGAPPMATGANPFAPTMSAGAGPFGTEPPPWSASAFAANPNAGAGRFITEASPFSSSAMTPDSNAGAGAFTTEWSHHPATAGVVPLAPFIASGAVAGWLTGAGAGAVTSDRGGVPASPMSPPASPFGATWSRGVPAMSGGWPTPAQR